MLVAKLVGHENCLPDPARRNDRGRKPVHDLATKGHRCRWTSVNYLRIRCARQSWEQRYGGAPRMPGGGTDQFNRICLHCLRVLGIGSGLSELYGVTGGGKNDGGGEGYVEVNGRRKEPAQDEVKKCRLF
jgi:hypothetical protein